MKIGTKSVLFGAHCFFLHPFFVAAAWWKLYGFPFDPRLWVAFIVHDLGYIGKPNMDGPEGEKHVELGAWIMTRLFDRWQKMWDFSHVAIKQPNGGHRYFGKWGQFSLFHSRYYAKQAGAQPSQLCFADKLSFALTPSWLYLPMVTATGEINEYLKNAQRSESEHWNPTGYDKKRWHAQLCEYMTKWVDEHKGGARDTWTSSNRHAISDAGVWQ
jgi:hypothetical protein